MKKARFKHNDVTSEWSPNGSKCVRALLPFFALAPGVVLEIPDHDLCSLQKVVCGKKNPRHCNSRSNAAVHCPNRCNACTPAPQKLCSSAFDMGIFFFFIPPQTTIETPTTRTLISCSKAGVRACSDFTSASRWRSVATVLRWSRDVAANTAKTCERST